MCIHSASNNLAWTKSTPPSSNLYLTCKIKIQFADDTWEVKSANKSGLRYVGLYIGKKELLKFQTPRASMKYASCQIKSYPLHKDSSAYLRIYRNTWREQWNSSFRKSRYCWNISYPRPNSRSCESSSVLPLSCCSTYVLAGIQVLWKWVGKRLIYSADVLEGRQIRLCRLETTRTQKGMDFTILKFGLACASFIRILRLWPLIDRLFSLLSHIAANELVTQHLSSSRLI
jgi:hypothetical protein